MRIYYPLPLAAAVEPFALRWAQILSEYLWREEDIVISPKAMIRK